MTTTVAPPAAALTLSGLAPSLLQSCILAPTPAVPPTIGDNDIYTPVAPGVTYAALPTVTIVDTSPTQVIGCANDVGPTPQQTLNALFPAAVTGDGVVDRATNDFWVYDGTTWNNVGPNPGPTVVDATIIPPWNEILSFDATVRTRLQVVALDYALALLTEPDPIGVVLGVDARIVNKISVPSADFAVTAPTPAVSIASSLPQSLMAAPLAYAGNGTTQAIEPGFPAGMVWLRADDPVDGLDHTYVYDIVQGPGKYWDMTAPSFAPDQQTDVDTITAFTQEGFTIGNSGDINSSSDTYIGHAFPRLAAPVTNTAGSITTNVAVGQCYSIATYTGNGTSGATVGHGLPTTPQFLFIKRLSGGFESPCGGGPIMGDDHFINLNSQSVRSNNTALLRVATSTTLSLGNFGSVNASGDAYAAYFFAEVPGVSRMDTYAGNSTGGGQFVDCGFEVDFVLVKHRNGGTLINTPWLIFDRVDNGGSRLYELAEYEPYQESDQMCVLESTGFRVYEGRGTGTFNNLNETGATYLFMAFARATPTTEIPTGAIDVAALTPSVN
jgi:hypothetical protein